MNEVKLYQELSRAYETMSHMATMLAELSAERAKSLAPEQEQAEDRKMTAVITKATADAEAKVREQAKLTAEAVQKVAAASEPTPSAIAEAVEASRATRDDNVRTLVTPTKPADAPPKKERRKSKVECICPKEDREKLDKPGLERCKLCGAVHSVKESPEAQPTVTIDAKAEPKPEAQVDGKTIDAADIRVVLIAYADKHGRPAAMEMLKKYDTSPGGPKLVNIKVVDFPALYKELTAVPASDLDF